MTSYILNDTEVKLTGRTAERHVGAERKQQLLEVTPANEDDGTWKKWVPAATLFKVQENPPVTREIL